MPRRGRSTRTRPATSICNRNNRSSVGLMSSVKGYWPGARRNTGALKQARSCNPRQGGVQNRTRPAPPIPWGTAQALPLNFNGLAVQVAGLAGSRNSTLARHSIVMWLAGGHDISSSPLRLIQFQPDYRLTVPTARQVPATSAASPASTPCRGVDHRDNGRVCSGTSRQPRGISVST